MPLTDRLVASRAEACEWQETDDRESSPKEIKRAWSDSGGAAVAATGSDRSASGLHA